MADDCVNELRASAAAQRAGAPSGATTSLADQLDRAADEIAKLREAIRRLAEQDATLSVCEGNVTVTMDATLTDAEMDDLRTWLLECLRQASTATEGCNEELAERWQERAKRAAAMIERLGGGR